MKRVLLSAALLALAFAPAPPPRPDKPGDDLKKLQGSWERLTYTLEGEPVTLVLPEGGPIYAVVEGERVTYTQGTVVHGLWKITLDPGQKPAQFAMTWEKSGRTVHGVYELKGDTLTLCFTTSARERPTDFDGSKPGRYLSVFRRVKPARAP